MIDTKQKALEHLISEELVAANKKFPQFQTMHEAYGVLKEEIEEVNEEVESINKEILKDYWTLCRRSEANHNKKETVFLLDCLKESTLNAINELIQVAAMIEKTKQLEK